MQRASSFVLSAAAAAVVVVGLAAAPATSQPVNCLTVSNAIDRLRCYDTRNPRPSIRKRVTRAAPVTQADDALIVVAKAAVRKQLLYRLSARFDSVKIAFDDQGRKGVCGTVDSRNALGGTTGPKLFAFDGITARIMVSEDGPENGTSVRRAQLGVALGAALKLHNQFCKRDGA